MNILISGAEKAPIYEQICNQIKNSILNGELKSGDPLPSLRLLANELKISMITTRKAYEILEREGFIATFAGKGAFVADANTDLIKEEHRRKAESLLIKALKIARIANITLEELQDMLEYLYDGEDK